MTRVTSYKAPDGGWGWVIVLAAFLLQALSVGNTYSFGIIYVDLLEYFKESQSMTAWIGSLQAALLYMICVLAGPPLKTCGWRIITAVGACISAAGFFLSSLAPDIYVLLFTYGVMTGAGFGVLYISSMVTVQHYFDKRRSLATGIAVSGSGIGTMTFGFLTRMLLDKYRWRLTVIIEGAMTLLVGVTCASLLRPPTRNEDADETRPILRQQKSYETIEDSTHYDCVNSQLTNSKSDKRSSGGFMNNNSYIKVHKDERQQKSSNLPSLCIHADTTKDGACLRCTKGCNDLFRLSLLRNPVQMIFCLTIICFSFGYHLPYMFTPERAKQMFNIESSKCSLLISIMGMTNVVSRVVFGWLGDYSTTLRYWMLGTAILLCGVLNTLVFLFTTFSLLVAYCICFGMCTGCVASTFVVVLVDLMGIDVIEYTLGLSLASASFIFLVASPMAGWIIEHTGSYDTAFLIAGVVQIIGGLVFSSVFLVRKRWPIYRHVTALTEQQQLKQETHCLFSETVA